jgi:hypothetical protein
LGFLPNSHLTFEKRSFQSFALAGARVGASLRGMYERDWASCPTRISPLKSVVFKASHSLALVLGQGVLGGFAEVQ